MTLIRGIFVARVIATVMTEAEQPQWYLVYSKPQQEDIAQFHLRAKGLENFLPKLFFPSYGSRRKRIAPLFPNYLFVRLRLFSEEFYKVQWSPGVNRIISFNDVPAPIDSSVIEVLMQQANADGLIEARPKLRRGQQVRIHRGAFDGLQGIIDEPPNAKGRIRVLMQLLSRTTPVELPIECVETDWVRAGDQVVA